MRARKRKHDPISPAWYVGYAEDDESVDAIMKKFEQLEQLQKEITPHDHDCDADIETNLSQDHLEELFIRTSVFTVQSAALNMNMDEFNDLYQLQDEEADDYQILDESGWNDVLERKPKETPREKKVKVSKKMTKLADRQVLLDHYKSIQIQSQDASDIHVKKAIAPTLPTYIRIPNAPIPRSWVKHILPLALDETPQGRVIETDVFSYDMSQLGTAFQAIYLDAPFVLPGQPKVEGQITVQEFVVFLKTRDPLTFPPLYPLDSSLFGLKRNSPLKY